MARARLALDDQGGGKLEDLTVIWRQVPKVESGGHWGHRIAFGPDGKLWITSSERQQFTPAQDMKSNLGKIVRLNEDGSVPADNPFFAQGGVTAQIWSLGHRNLLGLAFDAQRPAVGPRDGSARRRRTQPHRERRQLRLPGGLEWRSLRAAPTFPTITRIRSSGRRSSPGRR